jgi:hypothetical protein|mmetsp:Transcript_38004/g.103690  ORF Transcript_38004/g.103690 Transcript_38004/m.103690 type:complete len:170 (-) Transcript_38004:129-638(-)
MEYASLPGYIPLITHYIGGRTVHFRDWEPGYRELWQRWAEIDVLGPHMPQTEDGVRSVSVYCCSQFFASREALRRNPVKLYEAALGVSYLHDGAAPAKGDAKDHMKNNHVNWAGSAFEHIWHVILGQPADSQADALWLNQCDRDANVSVRNVLFAESCCPAANGDKGGT